VVVARYQASNGQTFHGLQVFAALKFGRWDAAPVPGQERALRVRVVATGEEFTLAPR
jgi:hypothetical protein